MTDAMDALFQYAQEQRMTPQALSLAEPSYQEVRQCVESLEIRLRSMLSDEAESCLDDLMEEQKLLLYFEDQALFRAGFQIALELTR